MTVTLHKRIAIVALFFFFIAIASRETFLILLPTVALVAWKFFWVIMCFVGLWVSLRTSLRTAIAELGLAGSAARGLGIALAASLPMLIVLTLSSQYGIVIDPDIMFSRVLVAAFTEEILFRGYLFRQLYRRAGWNFLVAILATALLFGLAHWSSVLRGQFPDILGTVGITTAGGIFFAWLFTQWGDNLWVPIGMHLFMNAWWELFNVGPDAIGTASANLARGLAVALAILLTRYFAKRRRSFAETSRHENVQP